MSQSPASNDHGLPGEPVSYWIASEEGGAWAPSTSMGTVDVAIVGGGFVGIMSAFLLKEAGLKVALIEAGRLARGVTGNTTAKITSLHRLIYSHLLSTVGEELAKLYGEANEAAIKTIEEIVTRLDIPCDFTRLPFYTFAQTDGGARSVEEEVKAAQMIGLPASYSSSVPLPFDTRGAVCFTGQAQFHPRRFLLPLAAAIPGAGSSVMEDTRALEIEDGHPCTVLTTRGKLTAGAVIVATNFPIEDKGGLFFARLEVMRSYVLAARVTAPDMQAMFINAEEDGHAFRGQPAPEGQLLLVSGEDHITGHEPDTRRRYRALADYVRRIYDNPEIRYSWSTQDNITLNRVPCVGRASPRSQRVFLATGFGQWGMTMSVASAAILRDLITGRLNQHAPVFDPFHLRANVHSAATLVSRNLKVAGKLFGGFTAKEGSLGHLERGEGGIVSLNGDRTAAYRDPSGEVHLLRPNCRHMGCVVAWNSAEKTWDCPCHGSRYDFSGRVLHSPAVKDLEPIRQESPAGQAKNP